MASAASVIRCITAKHPTRPAATAMLAESATGENHRLVPLTGV
jgi:hypothetical protein